MTSGSLVLPSYGRPRGVHPPLDYSGYRSTGLRHPKKPLVLLPQRLGNHYNAWRPAHIHFSLFGRAFTQRLVTQMYFPGDRLQPIDPNFNSVADPKARERMIAQFDIGLTQPEWALGYRWDIVLRGRDATVFEGEEDR